MGLYAEEANGICTNTTICEDVSFAQAQGWLDIDAVSPQPSIGWIFDGTTWSAPVPTAEQVGVATAQANVAAMVGQLSILLSQAQSDLTLWQGISTPSQMTDAHIASLIRRQDGWAQIIEGLWDLMTTMGIAPPRS